MESLGALAGRRIVISDLGVLGTAAAFAADAIRTHHADKEISTSLFYSASRHPSFCKELLPHFGYGYVDYLARYETLPQSVRTVRGYHQRNGRWVPRYEAADPERTRWIVGVVREVDLAVRLAHLALTACMSRE